MKVTWIGGDKQWLTMDDMRLHDLFIVTKYAVKNELTETKGWEWTSSYMDADRTCLNIGHAYKVFTFMKTIKFGVEVPQTNRQALLEGSQT